MVTAIFLIGGVTLFKIGKEPWNAVKDYIGAIRENDYPRAYIYLSKDVQRKMTLSEFTSLIKNNHRLYEGIKETKLKSLNISDSEAEVEGFITYLNGKRALISADLVKEEHVWRILKITIQEEER